MKKMFRKTVLAATLLSTLLFAACSDDDDDRALTLADLTGSYSGTFDFTPSPSNLNPAPKPETNVAIELKVENGKVVIPNFPATTLIRALLGEEMAGSVEAMLGTIAYEATIGTPTADNTAFTAPLTTPVLSIILRSGEELAKIQIESPNALRYEKSGALTFTLKTTQLQMSGAATPVPLVNELKFKVTKKK